MKAELPQDTEVKHCWICRRYHAEGDPRCPGVKLDRWGTWLLDHGLEAYLSVGIAAIFTGLLYICFIGP